MGTHTWLEQCCSCSPVCRTNAQAEIRQYYATTQEVLGHEAEFLLARTACRDPGTPCADHRISCRIDTEVEVCDLTVSKTHHLTKIVADHQTSRYPRTNRLLMATLPTSRQDLAPVARPAATPTALFPYHTSSLMQPAARARKAAIQTRTLCAGL
jgi:hypothetical protein